MSAKVFEAREHCKAAEKALKTTVFRWKADYDSAADEYNQAAQCFRIARDLPNSKECHLKASECFKKNNAFFHAAKALENAIIVCKEIAPPEEIYNLAMESASLYQQHGSGDSGASVLDKAAKILEGNNAELAVKLFQQAADVSSGHLSEPVLSQLDMLLTVNLPHPNLSRKLTSDEAYLWAPLTEKLNELWGPKKTTEEWIQVLMQLKEHDRIGSRIYDDDYSDFEDEEERAEVNIEPVRVDAGQDTQDLQVVAMGDVYVVDPVAPASLGVVTQQTQTESSQHQGSEYISKASRILVKLQWYDQAVDSIRREIGFHQESGNTGAIGRLTVAIVLVQLARGDAVAAEKAYKEWGSNCEVAEMQTLEQILQAYDEEDRESAKRALASPFIRNMDVEYARLAATVPLPEAMEPAPRATIKENAAPSYVSPNAQSTTTADVSHEEIEESPYAPVTYAAKHSDDEDGLC